MSNCDQWGRIRGLVELQSNFLSNLIPEGPGVCSVCRGAAAVGYPRCYHCEQHHRASAGRLAHAVVPVSYAVKRTQHAQNLARYKWPQPSIGAQRSLHALLMLFVRQHASCLIGAAGGRFTHLVTVPSTKGRAGQHPLEALAAPALRLPVLAVSAAARYPDEDRAFHADRFRLPSALPHAARVLLLDDTWTTGGRAQSLAFLLREYGADRVVCVVLGRHLGPDFSLNRPILKAVGGRRFDIDRCVLCSDGQPAPLGPP